MKKSKTLDISKHKNFMIPNCPNCQSTLTEATSKEGSKYYRSPNKKKGDAPRPIEEVETNFPPDSEAMLKGLRAIHAEMKDINRLLAEIKDIMIDDKMKKDPEL